MINRNKSYSKEKHNIAVINLALTPILLFLILYLNIPPQLKAIAMSLSQNTYISLIIFFTLITIVLYSLAFPLGFYSDYILEHKYSLSNQSFGRWIKKELKKNILGFIIMLPILFSLYYCLIISPVYWWFLTSVIWSLISIIITKLTPSLILPLFYRYNDIKNTGLKDKLLALASKAGFTTKGIYEIDFSKDTKKANAAVIGLGKQKRIILCDTLVKNFSEEEVITVMAHELGHHKLMHIAKLIIASSIELMLSLFLTSYIASILYKGFGYANIYDFEAIVLIYAIFSALNIILTPFRNAFSRKLEREADQFALELTDNGPAFIATMQKLSQQNLSDNNPGRFYEILLYSHPPISRRIALGESYKTKK